MDPLTATLQLTEQRWVSLMMRWGPETLELFTRFLCSCELCTTQQHTTHTEMHFCLLTKAQNSADSPLILSKHKDNSRNPFHQICKPWTLVLPGPAPLQLMSEDLQQRRGPVQVTMYLHYSALSAHHSTHNDTMMITDYTSACESIHHHICAAWRRAADTLSLITSDRRRGLHTRWHWRWRTISLLEL